jgi:4a-hydroxytetrahydrobiopterin dehydratase
MAPLTPAEIAAALATLPGWTHQDGSLQRTWRFASFRAAMAFMHACAPEIDRLDHHPEWSNSYDRVTARLCTHDAHGLVTTADVELARLLEQHAERLV